MPEPEHEPARPQPTGSLCRLPLLFLDVDGVLNPYALPVGSSGELPGFSDFSEHEARGFLLRLSPSMGRRLARLPAEICWATTWADTVDLDVVPYCELPPGLQVAARPPTEEAEALTNWKLTQVRRAVEQAQRPFAWLDDDALDWPGPDGRTARQWAGTLELPHLLLAPRPRYGLTPADLDRLEEWLDGLSARWLPGDRGLDPRPS